MSAEYFVFLARVELGPLKDRPETARRRGSGEHIIAVLEDVRLAAVAADHSIQTLTPALVATIDRAEMDAILERHPSVAKAMYIGQLIDEGTMRAWITSMGRRTSIARVAHLMCELYLRARNIGLTSDATLTLPLSQLLLADALGMTAVHINRVLKQLRIRGVMELKGGELILSDPAALAKIAGFDDNYLHRKPRIAS